MAKVGLARLGFDRFRRFGPFTRQPESSKRAHLRAPAPSNTTKIPSHRKRIWERARGKKRQNSDSHPSGPHLSGFGPAHLDTHKIQKGVGQDWIGREIGFGQNWPGQNNDDVEWIDQIWIGQNGIGSSRSLPGRGGIFNDLRFCPILNFDHFWPPTIAFEIPQCQEPWKWGRRKRIQEELP